MKYNRVNITEHFDLLEDMTAYFTPMQKKKSAQSHIDITNAPVIPPIDQLSQINANLNITWGTDGTCIFSGYSECGPDCVFQGLCMDKDNQFIRKMREEQKLQINPHFYCKSVWDQLKKESSHIHTNECKSRMWAAGSTVGMVIPKFGQPNYINKNTFKTTNERYNSHLH